MKSFIFYITVILLVSMLVLIIKNNEVKVIGKILTVAQYYSYVSDEEKKMEIPIYLNKEHHPLSDAESYLSIYFSNQDESKKIQMDLNRVKYGHVESYLNEIYHQYLLEFELPYLDYDFVITDLYIHVELINSDQYEFYLGSFSLRCISRSDEVMNWTGLHGNKEENSFLSRLKEIYVDFESVSESISQIEIGADYIVLFTVLDNRMTLVIPNEAYLLNDVPIIIYYSNNQVQVIPNFRYLIDYQILKESGPLIKAYAAD